MNKRVLALSLCLTVMAGTRIAFATLGERVDSVAKDRRALSAVEHATTVAPNYTIHESASPATVVREYVNSSGVVFAVAWKGRMHPDLTQILGSYADEFKRAKRQVQRKRGEKHLHVKGDQVVVQTWGHMGSLQGRAYLPSLLPAGVSVDDIK